MRIFWKQLIEVRRYLATYDSFETRRFGGVRINWDHYAKVLEAKSKQGLI